MLLRPRMVLAGFMVITGAALVVAVPAAAAPATLNGPCEGSGTFVAGGFTVNATESGVVEVPEEDDVKWMGSITAPADEQPYSGKIELELPPPFASWSIDSWSGRTDSQSNDGTKHYDIPSYAPRGVEMTVSGDHTQGDVSCSGSVKVKIAGGAFDSPAAPAALVATLLTGGILVFSGVAKKGAKPA